METQDGEELAKEQIVDEVKNALETLKVYKEEGSINGSGYARCDVDQLRDNLRALAEMEVDIKSEDYGIDSAELESLISKFQEAVAEIEN